MLIFLIGHLREDTTPAQLPNAHPIGEGVLPLPRRSPTAGSRGGRERSVERREGRYPGEWQLPTSGRASGEALPVAAAAAAVVVPGVFVPPVSRPWPAGGSAGPRRPSASSLLPQSGGCEGRQRRCSGVEVAEPPLDCKSRLPGNGLGPGGGRAGGRRRNSAPQSFRGGLAVTRPGRSCPGGPRGRSQGPGSAGAGERVRSRIRGQPGHPATYQAGEGGWGQRAGLPGKGPTRSSL